MAQIPFALYNPALLPPDVLLDEFTARRPLLENLLGLIKGNEVGHPPQHCLLVGARGMGKTTTLWAVAHRVDRDPQLSKLWQPVVFDEESRRVGDLADFWLEAIRQWEHATNDHEDRTSILLQSAADDIEDRARETFEKLIAHSGKRALLLIDNLNEVFNAIRETPALHRLRAFLMRDSGVMIIGGATSYFEAITSNDQPFYDFFRYFDLKPLTLDEMRECILSLAKSRGDTEVEKAIEERAGSIKALHLFTGGNPRLVKTFYRLLRDGLHADIRADLEKLLDEFTPYFKAIVDALPSQQQRIFDAVALAWNPIEVSKISLTTRLPSNQVSAQLRSLKKSGLIREAGGKPKKKTYLLTDRFSNIHYLMRHGRTARNRLDWFVATVRILFEDRDAAKILAKLAHDSAESGDHGLQDARDVLCSALDRADSAEARCHLLHTTVEQSWTSQAWESADKWFDFERAKQDLPEMEIVEFCRQMPTTLRGELNYRPKSAHWWYSVARFLEEKSAWQLAIQAYRKSLTINPKEAIPWFFLGGLLEKHLNDLPKAELAYRRAIEFAPHLEFPWTFLGRLQQKLSQLDKAEASYRKSIEIEPKPYTLVILGNLVRDRDGNFPESEKLFREAIEVEPSYEYAWMQLGSLLADHMSRFSEAEIVYKQAISINNSPYAHTLLGSLLEDHLNRSDEAEELYRKALELDPSNSFSSFRLLWLLGRKKNPPDDAIALATKGLILNPDSKGAQFSFKRFCNNRPDQWKIALPKLAQWCIGNPADSTTFHFTIDGLLRYSGLTSPHEALTTLREIPEPSPFETLKEALISAENTNHLHNLAPERQAVAIEMISRIKEIIETSAPSKKNQ